MEITVKPFSKASYLSQVRRLRLLGKEFLKKHDIKIKSMDFIHHGENTTFKIVTKNGSKYLLRIHRNDYHSTEAILEELVWLKMLAKRFPVPEPVFSKKNMLIEKISVPHLELRRNCCLFKWVDGNFINKSLTPLHMFKVGELLAKLQKSAPRTSHRNYWTAEGLLGTNAKFGSIDSLSAAKPRQQQTITKARIKTLSALKKYENKYPHRMGLIHADLHFGNLLAVGSNLGAIDFDDSGRGFFVYDLVIPYLSAQNILGEKKKHLAEQYKRSLIDGYSSIQKWDDEDERLFSHLVTARRLLMLGWLNSRSDNPRLKKHLKGAIIKTLTHIKSRTV